MTPIRERIIASVERLQRYAQPEAWTPESIAAQILTDIPEIAGLDGLHCRDCGGNLTELDLATRDGLCTLCRDITEAVPA